MASAAEICDTVMDFKKLSTLEPLCNSDHEDCQKKPCCTNSEDTDSNVVGGNSAVSDFVFSKFPNFEDIRRIQADFVKARNWDQFHKPRNLLLAMVAEVGELSEIFMWREDVEEGVLDWSVEEKLHLAEELSDVFLYLLRLAEKCHVDLPRAVLEKIALNAEKYPSSKVFGSAKKYKEYNKEMD